MVVADSNVSWLIGLVNGVHAVILIELSNILRKSVGEGTKG
jgi:hypothetical protein